MPKLPISDKSRRQLVRFDWLRKVRLVEEVDSACTALLLFHLPTCCR